MPFAPALVDACAVPCPIETSLAILAGLGLLAAFFAMRRPARRGHQPTREGSTRPTPPSGGSGVMPPARGRNPGIQIGSGWHPEGSRPLPLKEDRTLAIQPE